MQSIDEFRASLLSFGDRVQRVREHLKNEEATKVALILPFIATLGYDDRDPTEVAAEHASDFSDRYRNRVDYAILKDMKPVIAIECKSIGNGKKDDSGQLTAYFNATPSIKLGVLTDGVVYEFFVDSEEPNMMDKNPFLTVDFDKISKSQISDTVIDGLFALTKGQFNPDTVADNARKNITYRAFYTYLSNEFKEPSTEFTRFLLKENDIKHIRANAMESYRLLARAAIADVFRANVLRKLDIDGDSQPASKLPQIPPVNQAPTATPEVGIVTTDRELGAFEALRRRISFLVGGNSELFKAVDAIKYKDYQGKMAVFYGLERKGRILDIIEGRDGSIKFYVADGMEPSIVYDLSDADERIKALFEKRVSDIQ